MSLTPISLLDCTHLYVKFAVRERYRSAFTVTSLGRVFLRFLRPIVSSTVVLDIQPQGSMQF